jgi:uncharacterized protein
MHTLIAFLVGITFGLGLIISGMTNPAKIIGFLDITSAWDPSLLFVMLGAVFVAFFAYRKVEKKPISLLGDIIHLPKTTGLDKPLIAGAVLFGIGWALAGYCPGPALASLLSGQIPAVIFVISMIAGMALFTLVRRISNQ